VKVEFMGEVKRIYTGDGVENLRSMVGHRYPELNMERMLLKVAMPGAESHLIDDSNSKSVVEGLRA
jgi:hypothetical protein